MSVNRRIEKMELAIGTVGCPACGAGSNEPPKFEIHKSPPTLVRCELCGRLPISFTLKIGGLCEHQQTN